MHVRFWGTRGSIAKPGPETARYGGNTSCVEVRSASGTLLVLDCGTGAHALGQALLAERPGGRIRGHILIGHTHWDHIQGLPFFAPLFIPGNEWDIYGPKGLGTCLRETLAGQMEHTYFPVTLEQFGATVRYHDLLEGDFAIDDVRLRTHYLNHPALTLGYRIEADGATVVYSCDHEPHSRSLAGGEGDISGQDERYADFLRGADLVLHDAQYTSHEYPAKIGWGHSTVEYAVRIARHAGVSKIGLTHHDPLRNDAALDRIVERLRAEQQSNGRPLEVFAAAEGTTVEVEPGPAGRSETPAAERAALAPIEADPGQQLVVLCISHPQTAELVTAAMEAEKIPLENVPDPVDVPAHVAAGVGGSGNPPSLVMLEHSPPGVDGVSACKALREGRWPNSDSLPVILLADREDAAAGKSAGATEWLVRPFTGSYLRARARAWVLRQACRWVRAPIPDDEPERLKALGALRILDTEPEPRFDRITRLATALFNVPIALITLIDQDRQWFKSTCGSDVRETPRDISFCSHVVAGRQMMIVPDTLRDPRFGDNPVVSGPPRVRFYAGAPLILDNGHCVGTLCLVDMRVRSLESREIALLQDLRDLALQELRQGRPA
jgi:phosphoribosyl 1,2-cyclic phosphodiesterase/DNA-binding response OmpR family regulator